MGLREKLYFRALKMLTAAIVHLISGKRRETIHLALIIALAKNVDGYCCGCHAKALPIP